MSEPVTIQHITANDHVRLAVHRIGPRTGPTLILVPGTFSNATFWIGTRATGFARFMAGCGYDVCVLEPRGHGASDRPNGHRRHDAHDSTEAAGSTQARKRERWDFDDWARRDIPAAIEALTSHTKPAVLIGHSAGGAAIVAALAGDPLLQARVRGIILVATPLPTVQRWRGIAARAIRMVSRHRTWFPAKRFGLGPEDEIAGVLEQWMTWNIEQHWTGNDGTDYLANLPRISVPSFIVAANHDTMWAPPHACRPLYDAIGSRDKTFLLCGASTGFTTDFDHVSILTSRAAQAEIWPIMRNWLAALR